MRQIKLTQGKVALVSDEDWERVSQFKWCAAKQRPGVYAAVHGGSSTTQIKLHRFIMELTDLDGRVVDHINGDPLDNRRENLRVCSQSANLQSKNRHKPHRGVRKIKEKFTARINYKRKPILLGTFSSHNEAAKAHNRKALELYGCHAAFCDVYGDTFLF